jgi:hypothetical protein
MFLAITPLWQVYLQHNHVDVAGFSFNSYWIAHPTLERACGLLPFHFYTFESVKGWRLVRDFATRWIRQIQSEREPSAPPLRAWAFVNGVGGARDPPAVREVLAECGLAHHSHYSIGLDCLGSMCVDVFGGRIPPPHEVVAAHLARLRAEGALPHRRWTALPFADLVRVLHQTL